MSNGNAATKALIDWDYILDTIERRKCFLFLGPKTFLNANGIPLEEALCEFLDAHNPDNPYIKSFYAQDGFFLFREERFKSKVIFQIRKFFQQEFPQTRELYQKIARIPFQVAVSLTPDNLLSKTYRELGIEHQFSFYYKNTPPQPLRRSVDQLPVVYNFLGSLEEEESLILTHDDFYDYLASVIRGSSMDEGLKAELLQAKNYIILGLPFEKWYMQLLLRLLSLHMASTGFERYATGTSLEEQIKSLYHEQFKIDFITDGVKDFVDELYRRCEAKKLLREVRPPQEPPEVVEVVDMDKVIEFVARGDTGGAMTRLKIYLDQRKPASNALFTETIMLMSRFKLLESRSRQGVLHSQEDQVERAKLNYDLLELINKARDI